jgi:N-alpha-acetyl-L-2,4-diaminobutyrate deacetylase
MPRQLVSPAQLDLDTPGRRDYWVGLEHDTMWGRHMVPLTVWVGRQAQEGRGLVAFGSTHGNEYEGPTALKNLLGEIRLDDVNGRIILVPVLNVEAFRTGTRDSVEADRVNLNRAFVEGAGQHRAMAGITHRIAAFVRELIWPRVHVVIDIHSGGAQIRFQLCASYHPLDDPEQDRLTDETARWFGCPLIMNYQNQTPGLLTSEAERLGKITVGSEFGFGEAVYADGVRYAMHGVRAAAIHHGQMQGRIEKIAYHAAGTQRKAAIIDDSCYVAAPFPGHYEEVLGVGTMVKRGEVCGRLHDFARIDEPAWPVCAGVEGVIVGSAYAARVRQGQHILCVGNIVG